jgi:penicillin-binding protein A
MWLSRCLFAWGFVPVVVCSAIALGNGSAGAAPAKGTREGSEAKAKPSRDRLLAGLDPRAREVVDGKVTAPLTRGRAVLTVDPALDGFIAKLLKRNEVPYAGVVAIEPESGRVLAYVSHSSAEPHGADRALDASAPAASVFKVVTASALIKEGFPPARNTCYHGGSRVLTMGELVDNPRLDTACASLAGALGFSINTVFGKLALKHLDPRKLERQASAFGFGETLPFDVPTERSALDVPNEKLEFARAAAGFWHSHLSPLHGAVLAATVANGGKMMRPMIVDRILDEKGHEVVRREPLLHRNVLAPQVAAQVATLMRATVAQGTSRRTFHDRRGRPLLPGIDVAGKTGTLSEERPYRGYTWWVGFAPMKSPKIALAVLTVNEPSWRIKASQVAAETLRHYLVDMPRRPTTQVASKAR